MSACREGLDLFNPNGRRAFWRQLKRRRFPRLMWRDTFGRVLCWLAGDHMIHQTVENGGRDVYTSCRCCMRWLKQDERGRWVPK